MVDTNGVNTYGPGFSKFYDLHLNGWIRGFAPELARYLAGFVKPGATVIDLCCGTGETAIALRAAGWAIVGVDRSAAMLDIAAEKHADGIKDGAVQLLRADARFFEMSTSASACVCIDGALNHIDTMADLQRCFARVSAALEEDGFFVFDLLGAAHFAGWQTVTFTENEDVLFTRHGVWDSEANVALLRIAGALGPGPACWRFAETLRSRTFSAEEIATVLVEVGFEPMACALRDPRPSGREVYCAVKRASPPEYRP